MATLLSDRAHAGWGAWRRTYR